MSKRIPAQNTKKMQLKQSLKRKQTEGSFKNESREYLHRFKGEGKQSMSRHLQTILKLTLLGFIMTKCIESPFSIADSNAISAIFFANQTATALDEKFDKSDESEKKITAGERKKNNDSATEIRIILDGLEKKRLSLREEKQKINEEVEYLETLKQEIEEKVDTLSKIRQNIEEKLKKIEQKETEKQRTVREAKERKIKQLLKIYSNMKPKDVGAILDRLDFEDAVKIFTRMKDSQAAKILTYLDKDRAVKISEQLITDKGRENNRN